MPSKLRGANPPGGPTRGRVGAGDRTPTALASGEAFLGGEYTAAEWEYIRAVAAWQKKHRVRYPAKTDYLAIVLGLGYSKGRSAVSDVRFTVGEDRQMDAAAVGVVDAVTGQDEQVFGAAPGAADEVRQGLRAAGVPQWLVMLLAPVIAELIKQFDPQKVIAWLLARLGR